jgi:cytosine/adenosine deaminase-related metal-dependent hydrolase
LVNAGLTVAEFLATATTAAAAARGIGARTGKVARGHDADILAVDGHLVNDVHALLPPQALLLLRHPGHARQSTSGRLARARPTPRPAELNHS